jgi:hypothetical protein
VNRIAMTDTELLIYRHLLLSHLDYVETHRKDTEYRGLSFRECLLVMFPMGAPPLVTTDGTRLSIQAGRNRYAHTDLYSEKLGIEHRSNIGPWRTYEVSPGNIVEEPDESWKEYYSEDGLWSDIPSRMVADYLDKHGEITETYKSGIYSKFSVTEDDVVHSSYHYRIQSHVYQTNR